MSRFYTNIHLYKGKILHRFVEDGVRKYRTEDNVTPTIFFKSDTDLGYKTLDGEFVKPQTYDTVFEARDAIKRMEGMSNAKTYGTRNWETQWIGEHYPEVIEYDYEQVLTFITDIEVMADGGFPDPEKAESEITAITVYHSIHKKYYTFSYTDFKNTEENVVHIRCADESDLITRFISFWKADYPDIVTGWYSNGFDIPYICNRIKRVFGAKTLSMLSPFGIVKEREEGDEGSKHTSFNIFGVESVDYKELYEKYSPGNEESYSLGYIAQKELGRTKLEYEGSIHDFWLNDKQNYILYNNHDVRLIVELDAKLSMMVLQVEMAYRAKINYDEAFSPIRTWSSILYHHTLATNTVIPSDTHHRKDRQFEGAYVKDNPAGIFKWVSTVDAASLYPSMCITFNISPETMVQLNDVPPELEPYYRQNLVGMLSSWSDVSNITTALKENNMTMAANGQLYYRNKVGILPTLMKLMLDSRKIAKKEMIALKKQVERGEIPETPEVMAKIKSLSVREQGFKLIANSGYGAVGSEYFVLFDPFNAEAITMSGKLSNLALQTKVNRYINDIFGTNQDWVLAGDTDSIFIHLAPFVEKFKPADPIDFLCKLSDTKLAAVIDKICEENLNRLNPLENRLSFKREKIISTIVFNGKKKKYFCLVHDNEGVRYAEPKFPITGFETNRSSTPKFCRDKLTVVYRMIADGKKEELIDLVADIETQFNTLPVNTIAFPRGVSDIVKYSYKNGVFTSGTPIHNRAALLFNQYIKDNNLRSHKPIHSGDKIKFVYMKPNPLHQDVFGWPDGKFPNESGLEPFVDRRKQFEKSFLAPILGVTDAIGWHVVKTNEAMSDFFS